MATCAAPPQAPPPPRPEQCAPRPLGSRFWALAEDSSDDECVPPSPPPSASPAHRPSEFMVGDFICTALLSPVASRSGRGRRQAFAPGGRVLSRGASRPVPARRPPSSSSSAPARARVLGGLGSAVDSPEWLSHKMFPRWWSPCSLHPLPVLARRRRQCARRSQIQIQILSLRRRPLRCLRVPVGWVGPSGQLRWVRCPPRSCRWLPGPVGLVSQSPSLGLSPRPISGRSPITLGYLSGTGGMLVPIR
jgi:hypothetical protein